MNVFSGKEIDRIIEMAWEDRTPFSAIEIQFALKEKELIALMRKEMKRSSFNRWRKRVSGRTTKHSIFRDTTDARFKCTQQKTISFNKVSKR